ncbi:RAQPRD family integrative conjugative element protein [Xanthomonas citri]|uniref:integrative conjugative element protein, RAQPRD family n=1 Tax=Xanthomonas citri TaxID=346 RepID=UPI0002F56FA8
MSISTPRIANWRHASIIVLALCLALGLPVQAHADDATPERAHLAAALRQLDAIDRLVAPEIAQPRDERSRYHFDYTRLAADLERVRAGIRDYLSPPRAQPRDPAVLLGDYRQSPTSSVTTTEATP